MKVTPTIMTSVDFGGDNHDDPGLRLEAQAHVKAISLLSKLPDLAGAAGLTDRVTFVSLNVFGRTPYDKDGRQHHDSHAVSLLIGANVRGGVIGGIAGKGQPQAYSARSIDSVSGKANDAGDIGYADGLASFAKTTCAACGLDDATANEAIRRGSIVRAALVG